jgi:uncharacterized delta-60 repeat protein
MKKLFSVRIIILAGSLLLQLSPLCLQSRGAAGDVDLSFDPGSGVNGTVNAVVLQPDGKVLIGGEFTTVKGLVRPGLARLNADGTGDSSFNPAISFGGVSSIALQPDGKMIFTRGVRTPFGAELRSDETPVRLNSDGTVDNSFVAAILPYPDGYSFSSVAVQPDGKVLLGGSFVDYYLDNDGYTWYYLNYLLVRLNANGTFDTSFAAAYCGGFCFAGDTRIGSVTLQADGKVLIMGNLSPSGHEGVFRLNADFSVDSSFNPGTGPNNDLFSIALEPDGKVLIGGYFTAVNGTNRNGIARLNANGSLDPSFNPGTGASDVYSIALQPDGKVLIFGFFTTVNGTNRNGLARLNATGSLDGSFNPGTGNGGSYPVVNSFCAQTDGKVLIGGNFTTVNGTNRNYIARLNANGSLDGSFDPGARLNSVVASLVVQPDGKVLAGGLFSHFYDSYGLKLYSGAARLNPDGSLDNTYAPTNRPGFPADLSFPGSDFCIATCSAMQSDGKWLIGGYALSTYVDPWDGGITRWNTYLVTRFNADASRDTNFDQVIGNPDYGMIEMVKALAMQPDGKVLVGGIFTSIKGTNRNGIARLNANGTLDNGFNANAQSVSAIALQSDGKILIGGALARLNADGSPDVSFNPGSGPNGTVLSVALQPDGKVVIGGSFTTVNGTNRNRIARLNANGSLDLSFNPGTGANAVVRTIALQADGNVLIGGDFTTVNGTVRPYVARLYADFFAPSLSIARSNAFMIISWPVGGLNFQLQESTNLSLANGWSSVAESTITNAGRISVTIPGGGGFKLFRLRSQ